MKIGIIGAGAAGLVATWLLENDFEVVLLEQNQRLGGHVHTHYVELENIKVPIESGFEFFNVRMYPTFIRLLEILRIPTRSYKVNCTFYSDDDLVIIPPLKNDRICWRSFLPHNLFILIQLVYFLMKSSRIIRKKNKTFSVEAFTDSLYLTSAFKNQFLYPFLSAQWGCTIEQLKKFTAYDVLYWIVKNMPSLWQDVRFLEIPQGAVSYINALLAQISQAQIKTNAEITNITYNGTHYVITASDIQFEVDHLIVATNAQEASQLLKNIQHTESLRSALSSIKYITTHIAVHGDSNFMPKESDDWSVSNIFNDGIRGHLTIYKYWKSKLPIFRSWIFPDSSGFKMPRPLYSLDRYYHAQVNADYFTAQEVIFAQQGVRNLWLAGIYTQGIDSHESAVKSALDIARKIAPHSKRIKELESLP